MEITPRRIWTNIRSYCRKNNIVIDALSRLEKEDDEPLSETEEALILSHAMCAVEKDKEIVLPETKKELVMNIMIFYGMESEEFPSKTIEKGVNHYTQHPHKRTIHSK
jgi:hypothetical protein